MPGKGNVGIFRVVGNSLWFDRDVKYAGIHIWQNSSNCALKIYEDFTVCTLFLNKKNMKTYITICINQTKMCSAVRQYPES